MNRHTFLALAGATSLAECAAGKTAIGAQSTALSPLERASRPDFTVRIVSANVEVSPGHVVRTTTYGGIVPGQTLRMREGVPVTVDVFNDTDAVNVIHWHGQIVPPAVDGVIELGTPPVPAHGSRRYHFVPKPRGTRWYHSHVDSGKNTDRGAFSGEFGFVIVEPQNDPGRYDREVLLALHEWEPHLVTMTGHGEGLPSLAQPAMGMAGGNTGGMMSGPMSGGMMNGGAMSAEMMKMPMLEADYRLFSVNGRALGHGEPVRVRTGERVLLRVLNASATLTHRLALPGHRFTVVALDGNPVPTPRTVDAIELGAAERVDAIVEMNQPGVWVLGSTSARYRAAGLGIVFAYADHSGSPVWRDPRSLAPWLYRSFGRQASRDVVPAGRQELVLRQVMGTRNTWTMNGRSYPKAAPITVARGKRYRIAFRNMSMMEHPMHLHGHVFELASVDGISASGVLKDVVVVRPMMGRVEIDVVADNPGTFLLHCHNALHMDGGMATTLSYLDT